MTQRELAKLANVSFSTVSKAFNNSDDISEETYNGPLVKTTPEEIIVNTF